MLPGLHPVAEEENNDCLHNKKNTIKLTTLPDFSPDLSLTFKNFIFPLWKGEKFTFVPSGFAPSRAGNARFGMLK